MSDTTVSVIAAVFRDGDGAAGAMQTLRATQTRALVGIEDAAVIGRDDRGRIEVREAADMRGGKGFVLTPVAGAVIGVVCGPGGWGALGGSLVGDLAARLCAAGFGEDRLRAVSAGLVGEASALVAVVEPDWAEQVTSDLKPGAAWVVAERLPDGIVRELRECGALVYTTGEDGRPVFVERSGGNGARPAAPAKGAGEGASPSVGAPAG